MPAPFDPLRCCSALLACITLNLCLASPLPAASPPPNVLIILADDQGWGDLGLHGHPTLQTPHLDRLAHAGATFDRFYVQPVCAPTRAEFLTGRYHLRGGVIGVSEGRERLALRETTIADVFRAAGYATGCFGKWHNGTQYPYHPNGRGFDEFYGYTSGHWGSYFDAMLDHNGAVVQSRGFLADDLAEHTDAFIRQQHAAQRPFFAYYAVPTPHSPMQVPDAYWDNWSDREVPASHRFADREDRRHTRAALAMVENIDHNVGRLLTTLDELNIDENTIVVYFSDNGPNGWRWNADLKGIKAHADEGGVRAPLMIRWPGHISADTRVQPPAAAIDLLPTLAHLAGVNFEAPLPLDGLNLAPLLTGDTTALPSERLIFTRAGDHRKERISVRGDRWMLGPNGDLFDLANDPRQRHPLTTQHPEIVLHLQTAIQTWRAEMDATGAPQTPAIPLGHPDARFTPLPARDATLHGTLERSNRYPNDSYVRNWTQPTDHLSWEVAVPAAGRFRVTLYYTCPVGDEGAEVLLEAGNNHVSATITEPWDPPARGAEHDRIPRQESYVKDFRPLHLGEIHLSPDATTVSLRCPQIPGETAMEFRLLQFERLE